MLRWFIADLLTGRDIADVQVMESSTWSRSINKPEVLTAELDMRDPATIALHPRQTMAPGRTVLACATGDAIIGAGPIWTHSYDRDRKVLTLGALGMWSYFDHRFVLPLAAASIDTTQFILPDASAAGKTKPNPAVGTYLTALEYGTIAKRWVQQAQAWTGGNVPILFEADRVGTKERNFEGAEFKNLGTVLSQLSQIEGGPDIRFRPQFTADMLGIQWVLETGTDASPLLSSDTVFEWAMDVPQSPVSNLKVSADATRLATTAWATAGRSADTVLVSRSTDTTLTDLGYAAFETLDSSHSSVSEQPTLDGYTGEATTIGRSALELWSFNVEAARQPFLGAYWEGDFCTLTMGQYGKTTYTPWSVQATNLIQVPQATSTSLPSGWAAAGGSASGGWIISTAPGGVPYIFTGRAHEAFAVGDPVYGQIQVQSDSVNITYVRVNIHQRSNNAYYVSPTARLVVPLSVGVPVTVQLSWTATTAIPIDDLDISVVPCTAAGVFVAPAVGSVFKERAPILSRVPAPYFDGDTPSSDVETYAWTGTANASTSTYSTRVMQQYDSGDPYLFEGGAFQRRITALSGDAKGITVGVTTQAVV